MKFLVLISLSLLSLTSYGQSSAGLPANTSTAGLGSRVWETIKAKTQIRYFSETLGPSVTRGGDRTPEFDEKNNFVEGQDPINVFNQISINWKLNSTWTYILQPRFTYQLGATDGYNEATQESGPFRMEDTRTGVQGTYWANADQSVALTVRAAVRLPTDRANRNNQVYLQPDLSHFVDVTINPKWSLFLWQTYRSYMYHSSSSRERWRLYNAPGFTYTFNDKWQLMAFYENEIAHNIANAGEKKWNYAAKTTEDIYIGPQYKASPSLTLYPFLRPSQLEKPSLETTAVGLWVTAKVFN